jgi:ubiquitin carboxyl-terminal hydrolase 48
MSSDTEPCSVCNALIYVSREDKRELRKIAEDEKVRKGQMGFNLPSITFF